MNYSDEKSITPALNDADKAVDDNDQAVIDENLVKVVVGDFLQARDYVKKSYLKKWEDCWKCYNSMRTHREYDGVADDFVPETFTIIESVKAQIAGGKPKFTYLPTKESQESETEILNQMVDFFWAQNNMTEKVQQWVQDMLVYGNGIFMVSWDGGMPCITNIPLSDFFVDPTATHMNVPGTAGYPKYAGYRFLSTVDELKNRKLVNPDTGEMDEMYKNLDDLGNKPGSERLSKEEKELLIGTTLTGKALDKQVEVLVYYTRKKKIVIANRNTIIYEGDNPYKREARTKKVTQVINGVPTETTVKIPEIKGFLPFAILRDYVDTSLFYAKGDVEQILLRQERLNDISSQKSDAITYALSPMWQIDPQYKHLAEQIESFPGAVLPLPQGAISTFERQDISASADNEMYRIKEEMRRATAADEVIQGVSQDKGRITATEVQAQQSSATQRFTTKLTNLEDEGYAQLGRIIFWMCQIFITQPMAIRIIGPEGIQWKDYDPDEYYGDYEPKVELESTVKANKQADGQKYALIHQMYAQSPYINQQELAKLYLESVLDVSEDRMKSLLTTPQQNPMPPVAPPQPGQAPQNPMGVPSGPLPMSNTIG